jgi:hypothetical protein
VKECVLTNFVRDSNLTIQLSSFQAILYNLAKAFQNNSESWPGLGDSDTLTDYCCPASISYVPLRTKNIPFHTLRRRWEDIMSDWDETPIPIEIANIVKTYSAVPEVSKVVCLGLGSFSEQFGTDTGITVSDRNPIYRPMRRHAVAVSIAKAFTNYTRAKGKAITLYAQDPAYTDNDKNLLREIGFEPVPGYGARGFGLIDDETVVFSCCPTAPVKQIVADLARPVAMIWERVQEEDPIFTKEQMAAL